MDKPLVFLFGFFMLFSSMVSIELQDHKQSYVAKKYIFHTVKDTLIKIGAGKCPEVEDKYIDYAKKRLIDVFNTPRYQEGVTELELENVTLNDIAVLTDPEECKRIKGYIEKWIKPTLIKKKYF